jgi:aspartyl-tRNA(Asn)/glutamyl-tRNA(Gln) amidotransferase subunit A
VRTTAASKVRADAPPAQRDATLVARMRAAGAIVLGKTNTHEFAYGLGTPPTSNPWDDSRIPGGSSGGSAAALASGMCLGASGTDTGGSIRIPSSLCGTVGIKPTFGRVSKAGVIALSWTEDHAGPMARSVEDCALILNAIAGPDAADPTAARARVPDFTRGLRGSIRGRVIGVPTSVFFGGADAETAEIVRRTLPVFKSLGARIVPLKVPSTQQMSGAPFLIIVFVEALTMHEHYLKTRPQDYQYHTQSLLGAGTPWHGTHYVQAQRIRTINIREWMNVFKKVDAVLCPTTPRPAPTKEDEAATGAYDLINYTAAFDFNGCPSISVPAGTTKSGLPVGLMLSGRPFDEPGLLRLAYAYQEATGFNRRRPPLR